MLACEHLCLFVTLDTSNVYLNSRFVCGSYFKYKYVYVLLVCIYILHDTLNNALGANNVIR